MSIKSPLSIFCDDRGMSERIKLAFGMYIRTTYAQKYRIKETGETIHLIMGKLSQEDLAAAWQDFVKDLAEHLNSEQ